MTRYYPCCKHCNKAECALYGQDKTGHGCSCLRCDPPTANDPKSNESPLSARGST